MTICTPTSGSTVTSPFVVSAGTTDTAHPVTAMKIYLDFVAVASTSSNVINATLNAAAGSHHLTVSAWDSSGTVFKTSLTFTVGSVAPGVQVSPTTLSFGDELNGQTSAPKTVTITNNTGAVLTIGTISATASQFTSSSNCGSSVAIGGSCQVIVTFTPSAVAPFSGTLTINDSGAGNPQTVALAGNGVSLASLAVTPASPTVAAGATRQLTATGTFSDNTTRNLTTSVTWSSSNTAAATVSNTAPTQGLASGVAPGQSTITAALGTISGVTTLTVTASPTFTGVLTSRNDNLRTGQNLQETVLTPANVNSTHFGKLLTYAVDGAIYGQPLYVPSISAGGKVRNVVYVATENDSVYAFDADTGTAPLWKRTFINPTAGITIIPQADVGSTIFPGVGITSTPVIDLGHNAVYVVAATKENGTYFQRLHALDLTTGAENFGGPVAIQGAVAGTGTGSVGGSLAFQPEWELQRAALLLDNGRIYITFASEGDHGPFHGWVFAYDAGTLARVGIWNATPNGAAAGIWQAGSGLAADANGNIFGMTGNGTFDAASGGKDVGDSFFKLTFGASGLGLTDFFTPFNQAGLSSIDLDLGSGGPLLLPDQPGTFPHLMIGAGKEGVIYVVNRDNLGHFQSGSNSQIVQSLSGVIGNSPTSAHGAMYAAPAIFGNQVYFAPGNDVPKAFSLTNGLLSTAPVSKNGHTYPFPGATPTVSASGNTNGIIWTIEHSSPGVLHAYDATNLGIELYNSNLVSTRDTAGTTTKFSVPTVANGKVYVGTNSKLIIYGLLP